MDLQRYAAEGSLTRHSSSAREIRDHFHIVRRDLADASLKGYSDDRRFAIAYNAALQLATIVLRASGYRATGAGHHKATIEVLPELMGSKYQVLSDYFDKCRSKRNITEYDRAGTVQEREVVELIGEVEKFRDEVTAWLAKNHPEL